MSQPVTWRLAAGVFLSALGCFSSANAQSSDREAMVRQIVDEAMKPVIEEHGVPGLAVGLTIDGQRYFLEYGVAAKKPREEITRETLFELGSISKTFTATLATYAEVEGKLSMRDSVTRHMSELQGSALDDVRVLDLGTHTAGGFPLQFPDGVKSRSQLIAYYRDWKPEFTPGTHRTYANPSVGLLGMVAVKSMGENFKTLMEKRIFPEFGLERTYIDVPAAEMKSYAWGYNNNDKPVRAGPGMLAAEAYGVKSNTVDMVRFLEVNMGIGDVPEKLARAVSATHIGYFRAGELVQDLIWEQYPYPVELNKIVAGNSGATTRGSIPAEEIDPPMQPRGDVIINKTGSTNGFGAYVAYVPGKKIGIVMLANKRYPNEVRVKAAHQVLSRLAE
ncbi:class C beta-lactamase [Mesorhizobium sp. SB112]|uniref:class C beta-lactamase n=1 Tax=Mesorhizobium sp. SB112 TaxID=3151853 RepID=UPI003265E8C1